MFSKLVCGEFWLKLLPAGRPMCATERPDEKERCQPPGGRRESKYRQHRRAGEQRKAPTKDATESESPKPDAKPTGTGTASMASTMQIGGAQWAADRGVAGADKDVDRRTDKPSAGLKPGATEGYAVAGGRSQKEDGYAFRGSD